MSDAILGGFNIGTTIGKTRIPLLQDQLSTDPRREIYHNVWIRIPNAR
jgi:hypothetical protein